MFNVLSKTMDSARSTVLKSPCLPLDTPAPRWFLLLTACAAQYLKVHLSTVRWSKARPRPSPERCGDSLNIAVLSPCLEENGSSRGRYVIGH